MKFIICFFLSFNLIGQHDEYEEVLFNNVDFLNAILNNKALIDLNNDGKIQTNEAHSVKVLDLMNMNLNNAEDIYHFPNVEEIILTGNNIEELDVNGFKYLRKFYCAKNKLKIIKLRNLPSLDKLSLSINFLSQITLFDLPNLSSVNLMDNQLVSIDLSLFNKLSFVDLEGNKLNNIDFANNPELVQFNILGNNIKSVDITNNLKLNMKILYLDDNVKIIGTDEQLSKYRKMPIFTEN